MKRGIAKVNIVFTLTEEYFVQPLRLLNGINFILNTDKGGYKSFCFVVSVLKIVRSLTCHQEPSLIKYSDHSFLPIHC